jgi:phosphoribosylaminoimidazolecarboxamide formyltransferase/IMP cyclohydrolase
VVIVPSREEYEMLHNLLLAKGAHSELEDRKWFATRAFRVSSHYDKEIYQYFNQEELDLSLKISVHTAVPFVMAKIPTSRRFTSVNWRTIFCN